MLGALLVSPLGKVGISPLHQWHRNPRGWDPSSTGSAPVPEAHLASGEAHPGAMGDGRVAGGTLSLPPSVAATATAALWGFPLTRAGSPPVSQPAPAPVTSAQQPRRSTSLPPQQPSGGGAVHAHTLARAHPLNPPHASPVHAPASVSDPAAMPSLPQPCTVAVTLANSDAKLTTRLSIHRRTPSSEVLRGRNTCSKVSSVASSMVSQDSTWVD